MKKINLIFGDEVDESIVSGDDSAATTPGSESGSSIGEKSDNLTDVEKKAANKKASKKERFRKMKDNLVDAIWNQSECFMRIKSMFLHHAMYPFQAMPSKSFCSQSFKCSDVHLSGKYNKDTLLMSPIFVALVTDYALYEKDLSWCKYSLEYSIHPVFRIMKCRSKCALCNLTISNEILNLSCKLKKTVDHTDAA